MNRNIILCVIGYLFINLSFVFAGLGKIEVSSITAQGDLYVGTNLNLNDNNINDVTGIVASTVIVNGNVHVSTLTTTYNLSAGTLEVSGAAEADSLTVTGDIEFDGGLDVLAAANYWYIVAGSVNSSGSKVRGTGFTSSRSATGTYVITFTEEFSYDPMVVVTHNESTSDDIFVLASRSTTSVTIEAYDESPSRSVILSDSGFDFIVVGSRA